MINCEKCNVEHEENVEHTCAPAEEVKEVAVEATTEEVATPAEETPAA